MSKTADLRKLIREQLQTVQGITYHKKAPPDAAYPYKTYVLKNVSFQDERDDFDLDVDIWDRSPEQKTLEEMADQIEKLFKNANLPQETILPTFFRENRYNLDDPDKSLQHIQLRFSVQLYEIEKEE